MHGFVQLADNHQYQLALPVWVAAFSTGSLYWSGGVVDTYSLSSPWAPCYEWADLAFEKILPFVKTTLEWHCWSQLGCHEWIIYGRVVSSRERQVDKVRVSTTVFLPIQWSTESIFVHKTFHGRPWICVIVFIEIELFDELVRLSPFFSSKFFPKRRCAGNKWEILDFDKCPTTKYVAVQFFYQCGLKLSDVNISLDWRHLNFLKNFSMTIERKDNYSCAVRPRKSRLAVPEMRIWERGLNEVRITPFNFRRRVFERRITSLSGLMSHAPRQNGLQTESSRLSMSAGPFADTWPHSWSMSCCCRTSS